MKKRQFNTMLRSCLISRKIQRIDPNKVSALPEETREAALHHIVRNRGPILVEFTTQATDWKRLRSMGYFHLTTGASGYTFVHTNEHQIK